MPIDRNNAQYITGAIYKPTQTSAPGVWDLDDQANNTAKNLWPLPPQAVQRSLRFNSADSTYLNRTFVAGNRTAWTWSGWIKRTKLGIENDIFGVRVDGDNQFRFYFNPSDKIDVYNQVTASIAARLITTQVFRDPSAWFHIVLTIDTTNGTAGDRFRLYVNGSEITAFDTDTQPSSSYQTFINSANPHYLGYFSASSLNAYLADVNFIDGQALTPASFGETDPQTGVWIPKRYTGTYGTNGFRLSFANNSSTTALGYDSSGQGNNWTANNFSVTPGVNNDVFVDVPSLYGTDTGLGGEVIGNYATLNPLNNGSEATLSNGNLDVSWSGTGGHSAASAIAVSSGKWYVEFTRGTSQVLIGIIPSTYSLKLNNWPGSSAYGTNSYGYYSNDGFKFNNSSSVAYGATFATGDVIGVALDLDAGTLTFYKNGVSQGTAYSSITGSYVFAIGYGSTPTGGTAVSVNFGQRPFAYPAPTGYKALCTTNLPAPAIGQTAANQADNHFDVVIYTGNGGTQTISTLGFQPDLVWIKNRTGANSHILVDSIRGAGKGLSSESTAAEYNIPTDFQSFNSNGFTVGYGGTNITNASANNYVAWCWNAGGTTVTNTSGTITSQVRANQRAGFSIVTYTGTGANATVGHGLSSAPQFLIVRNRDTVYNWRVWHTALSGTQLLYFNTTDSTVTDATMWNSAIPTSSVFSVGTNGGVNESTKRIIAYCWSEIPGYSAFGKYDAGSNTNPFIYTGFKPAFVMIKSYSGAYDQAYASWTIYDNKRNPTNKATNPLFANLSAAEGARGNGSSQPNVLDIDLLSNGFKILVSATEISYGLYVYAAFAETPARLSTAR